MTAVECLQEGRLDEAVAAATDAVKASPGDVEARGLLCELLCFAGDLERADQQLDTIANVDPERAIVVAIFRQQIRGELWRRECFESGRMPEFIGEPGAHLRAHLRALVCVRDGRLDEAAAAVAEAEATRPRVSGTCNESPFDDIRDIDDTCASFLEVISNNGKYFWIGFDQVTTMELVPPARNRDLLWRPAHLDMLEGPEGDVFLPALYPGSARDGDDNVRLGRATQWVEVTRGLVRGLGQRVLLAGDGDVPLHEVRRIELRAERADPS